SSRRRHTRSYGDWSSDVCSSDLDGNLIALQAEIDVQPILEASALEVLRGENGLDVYLSLKGNEVPVVLTLALPAGVPELPVSVEIGRASCRARVQGGDARGGVRG